MQKTYIFISLFVLIVIGAVATIWTKTNNKIAQPIACTMEAKLCPDGTSVGRTGPNCEFAACTEVVPAPVPAPTPIVATEDVVLGVGQKGEASGISITVNSFVSDSRCPVDVQCIWAGEFKANVTLLGATKIENRVMSSIDTPYSFDGNQISITAVTPAPKSKIKIGANEYRITFHVVKNVKKVSASTGTISGRVTLSPICPVERMPPEPQCAPKPYQTKVEVFSSESGKLVKTIQTGSDGTFSVTLPLGFYKIEAGTGTVYPRCSSVAVHLQTATTSVDVSCDTGIR